MSSSPDYFGEDTAIFANKELLQVSHLPDGDQIIGREEELKNLGSALRPALNGNTPSNVFLYGKTGTGKSLCSKFISRQMMQRASDNGVRAGFAYVDCLQDSTETQAVQSAGHQLNDPNQTNVTIPQSGLSTAAYYKRLWDIIENHYDVAIIILDEVDKLESDHILMQLSRAVESGKLEESKLGVIGISNKIRYKDDLNERIKSSLCERDYVFPPYDANQLREILYSRNDAFVDDVLDQPVIPHVAALAAQEHGDARQAIDILRYAGEIAEERGDETVREEHVSLAQEKEEQNRIAELISKAPTHTRYVLLALAFRVQQSTDADPEIPNKNVYETYQHICEQENSDPLKQRRVRDLLSELEFLGIIKQDRRGRGRGKGGYTVNHLVDEPELVLRACKEDPSTT
jgi:archaeal cell division control protein 6